MRGSRGPTGRARYPVDDRVGDAVPRAPERSAQGRAGGVGTEVDDRANRGGAERRQRPFAAEPGKSAYVPDLALAQGVRRSGAPRPDLGRASTPTGVVLPREES